MPNDIQPMRAFLERPTDRRAMRQLDQLNRSTRLKVAQAHSSAIVRTADVQAEAMVATAKIQEINRVAKEAISGHVMLRYYADTMGHGDPMLADELRFFTDMAGWEPAR